MQYKNIFTKHEPEFIHDMGRCDPIETPVIADNPTAVSEWDKIKKCIIDQQLYLRPGVTVKEMCALFHTNRTTFSSLLNRNEELSFSLFINRLRIEHAKKLVIENPEITIAEVAQQCGFTEQSNFTRQFRLLCDQTPAVWAKEQRKCTKA